MAKTPRRREFDSVRQFQKFGSALDKLGNKSSGPTSNVTKLEDSEYYERKMGADIIEARNKWTLVSFSLAEQGTQTAKLK